MTSATLLGICTTLFCFMALHTGCLIWWASGITAQVRFMAVKLDEAVTAIKSLASKESVEIIHKRIDKYDERLRKLEDEFHRCLAKHHEMVD